MISRTAKSTLTRHFGQCGQPVFLINHQRKIVFANLAAESFLGFEFEKLNSAKCNFHGQKTGNDLEDALATICPPPESFAGQRISQVVDKPGKSAERFQVSFMPLTIAESPTSVLVIVDQSPIEDPNQQPVGTDESRTRELLRRAQWLWARQCNLQKFIGRSAAAKQILAKSEAAVGSGSNLVIFGPAGSGRQHLARSIHNAWIDSRTEDADKNLTSSDMDEDNRRLLIPLDARVADAEVVQSTFTSLFANQESTPQATGGRLLLLDADSLDSAAQNELLSLLRLHNFDVNISSTATRSLIELSEEGKFDKNLAAMLATIEIEIPPLQERLEDIPVLSQLFVEQHNAGGGRQLSGITTAAMDCLLQYAWPGNVEELSVMIAQAAKQAQGLQIDVDDLPKRIRLALSAEAFPPVADKSIDLDDFLRQVETELIQRAMKRAKGNKTKAAELLGINRARLIRRLESLNSSEPVIDVDDGE